MTVPGRLEVAADGRVTGPAAIAYNDPFPCVNGSWGSGAMRGVVMHTMVGNLPGTVQVFNTPSFQASAFFGVAQDGSVHQFGPVGKGWIAWAQVEGNLEWYSIEHADDGNPDNPLTDAQIAASAQLVEVLSRFAGFPLQVCDTPAGKGYGTHVMGGAAWGGHTCPDLPPEHVRSRQRPQILVLAERIRAGLRDYVTTGELSLVQVAAATDGFPAQILAATLRQEGHFGEPLARYIDAGDLEGAKLPSGITLRVPGA